MEVCLINLNKRDGDGEFKILQYSEMECNCVTKITEVLFRKYVVRYDNISVKVW